MMRPRPVRIDVGLLVRLGLPVVLPVVLLVGLLLAPGRVRAAGGGSPPTLGNEAAMSGGAVVAAGRGGSMAWYNPAGLGANRRGRLEASAQLFMIRVRRIDRGLSLDLPDGAHGSQIRSRELLVLPSATIWVIKVAPRTNLALSLFVPTFDEVDIDTFAQRRFTPIEYAQQIKVLYQQRRYDVGPSLGFQPFPSLRLGVGAFVVYEKTAQSSRAWAWGNAPAQGVQRFVLADVSESVRSWGTEFVAGLQWQPTEYLHLGLAVRSPRLWFVQTTSRSSVAASGGHNPTRGEYGELAFEPNLRSGLRRPNDPTTVTAGLAYQWRKGQVAIEGDISPARSGGEDRGQKASWALRLGMRARLSPRFTLGAGLYTQRSAAVLADDFLEFDLDTYGATLGAELRRPVQLGARERARRLVFTTTVALRYTVSIGRAGPMRIDLADLSDEAREVLIESGTPVAARVYDLALSLGSGLEF
ncbi:MAG: hypothetical protein IAG13_32690 [Deltaproteobacteria bacterium]|nr:hypothetical protein [Nannocystaceae bacterium]